MRVLDAVASDRFVGHAGSDMSSAPLIAALASYLTDTRDPHAIRDAIAQWCDDVTRMNLQPQVLLIQFKQVFDELTSSEQSEDYETRLADRRDMILMCIQEFYRQ